MARVTIRDVARRADVSFKTVSRVLNGVSTVNPELKRRVDKAVAELGFRPNRAARMLSGGRSSTLGLIMLAGPNSHYERGERMPTFIADVITGSIRGCRGLGYHLMVHILAGDPKNFAGELDDLLEAVPLDGVILMPPSCDLPWLLEELEKRKLRFARLLPGTEAGGISLVVDNVAAGEQIAELVLDGKHRKIGLIRGPDDHLAAIQRAAGFRQRVLAAEGATLVERGGDFLFQSGFESGISLLNSSDRPTAIFAANDEMAAGVLAAAGSLNLSVPADVSIVGYGDLAVAQQTWPMLTTVSQHIGKIAETCAQNLIGAISDNAPVEECVLFPHTIIRRGSFADLR